MKTRKLKAMSKNKIILLVLSFLMTSIWNTYAQVATVSGVVQDKSGETIIGANVLVKGTANGAITDLNGKFTISGVSTNGTLVVTYIGYVSKEIAVKNQTNFIITLEEDSRALEEVVVIGYQTVKRKDLTGFGKTDCGNACCKCCTGLTRKVIGSECHDTRWAS